MDAGDLAAELAHRLRTAADPARARGAQAYMKTSDPFFGVGAVPLRRILQDLAGRSAPASQSDYLAQVAALWTIPEREGRYAAVDWARRFRPFITVEALPHYERMIREGAWWDTVDAIAAHLVGRLLLEQRARLRPVMESWIQDPDPWIRRAALLAHLKHRGATDRVQLFAHCLRLAPEKGFFLRKAIGWSLREYSKTAPGDVRAFLETHPGTFSGLSVREALKVLDRGPGTKK